MENEGKEGVEQPKEENATLSLVERAERTAERIESGNKKTEELLKNLGELETKRVLAGKADAGTTQEKPKEETPKEYKDRIMRNEPNKK